MKRKCKYCKTLLTFASGVVVGVVGISLYELFGKPVLPKVDVLPKIECPNCGGVYISAKFVQSPFADEDVSIYYVCWTCLFNWYEVDPNDDEYDHWLDQFNEPKPEPDKADTQPVRVVA